MFVFGDFATHVKLRPSAVTIDNIAFKFHYGVTFWFLLACTLLVSSKQFIDQHIDCISDDSVTQVINTFCFFSSTFTIARLHNASYLQGVHTVSSGVGAPIPTDEKKHHAYYQWVPFVLGAQAILFYAPHFIWKRQEKGRIRGVVDSTNASPHIAETDSVIQGYTIDSFETREKKENLIKETYLSWTRLKLNRDWTTWLVLCEVLNLLNVFMQIAIVDYFLKGNFLDLGTRWLDDGEEVLDTVFPKITKCTFHKYGSSGSIQDHDALCVMSLNIINEKLYTMMWFWFAVLLAVTVFGLVWRLICLFLHSNVTFNRWLLGEVSPGRPLSPSEIEMVATELSFSDWLFLLYIGENLDPRMFRSTISGLSRNFNRTHQLLSDNDKSYDVSSSTC